MTPKNKQALMARPLFIIVVAAVVAPMTSSAAASMVREKQHPQPPGSKV
ncbi:MAG: hypothetical protein WCF23_12130 [Candidatus Nitrosopolaris sp.]